MQVRRSYYHVNYLFILMCCFVLGIFSEASAQDTSGGAANTVEIPTDEATVAQGRSLFGQHCTACHQIGQQVIGPALASVYQRRPLPWLLKFIKNSQNVINDEKDAYAVQLYEQYNRVVMPNFEFLSNDDIIAIMSYIKAESSSSTSSGGVNGASSSNNVDEATSMTENSEAYSQKDNSGETSEDVSSGLPLGTIFLVLAVMLVLIGIIFAVARKSGKQE